MMPQFIGGGLNESPSLALTYQHAVTRRLCKVRLDIVLL